jgi:hypothetical protein
VATHPWDPQLLLDVLRFAGENILLGYSFQEYSNAGNRLDQGPQQAGTAWEVVPVPGRSEFQLRRRVSPATTAAVTQNTAAANDASDQLDQCLAVRLRTDGIPILASPTPRP